MVREGVRGPDWVGRGIGLAVFAGGIALLILVFVWTNQLGQLIPERGQKLEVTDGIRFGVAVAKLFISGLVASWIAGRGAQLYGAASRALSND
jgi:hypothetical protein